jgi:hypothetical protein
MAGALDKYRVSVDPTNQQRFSFGDIGDFVGDMIDNTPIGYAKGFFTGDSGSGLGSKLGSMARGVADGVTDTLGLTNQGKTDEAYSEAQNTLSEQQAAANAAYGQAAEMIGTNRAEIADIIGPETMEKYKRTLYEMRPTDYTSGHEALTGFGFDRDVSKYLDPNAEYVIDESVKAAQQAMAGQGGLTGGSAARALQAEASAKAGELYGDAFDRMMKATEQEYQKARDITSAEQTEAQQRMDTTKFKTEQLGNLAGSYVGNLQGTNEDLVNLLMAQMGTNLSLAQAKAQLGIDAASRPTWLQQLLGIFGSAAQIYSDIKP